MTKMTDQEFFKELDVIDTLHGAWEVKTAQLSLEKWEEEAAKPFKMAADMPPFTKQDRPEKVKDIYRALKREHPGMPAEMKARIAARQGKHGKQEQGPPYKGPLTKTSAVSRKDYKAHVKQLREIPAEQRGIIEGGTAGTAGGTVAGVLGGAEIEKAILRKLPRRKGKILAALVGAGIPIAGALGGLAAGSRLGYLTGKRGKAATKPISGALNYQKLPPEIQKKSPKEQAAWYYEHHMKPQKTAADALNAIASKLTAGTTTGLHQIQQGETSALVPDAPKTKTGQVIESTGDGSPKALADALQFSTSVGESLGEEQKDKKKLFAGKMETKTDQRLSQEKPQDTKVEPEQIRPVTEAKTAAFLEGIRELDKQAFHSTRWGSENRPSINLGASLGGAMKSLSRVGAKKAPATTEGKPSLSRRVLGGLGDAVSKMRMPQPLH